MLAVSAASLVNPQAALVLLQAMPVPNDVHTLVSSDVAAAPWMSFLMRGRNCQWLHAVVLEVRSQRKEPVGAAKVHAELVRLQVDDKHALLPLLGGPGQGEP